MHAYQLDEWDLKRQFSFIKFYLVDPITCAYYQIIPELTYILGILSQKLPSNDYLIQTGMRNTKNGLLHGFANQ